MEIERSHMTVGQLLALYGNGMLKANPEYQRGVVWSQAQKRKLIDSVLRGYPLPLIYLHHIKKSVAGMMREDLEVIDGQQRITALFEFAEGAFKLFDAVADEKLARFPNFIKKQPCSWGRKDFSQLEKELQDRFLNTELAVAKICSDNANEVRDLFVRLQAGLPLSSQETRDAWPGEFTDFVLRIGGKPKIARYPGHGFFSKVMGMKPDADRGKTRQLAAQLAMLFFQRRASGSDAFTDINSTAIDDFYYANIDFDSSSPDAARFLQILDKLEYLLGTGKHPKVRAHDAIHLVLLVDLLWDDYTRSWEATLSGAWDQFAEAFAKAKVSRDSDKPDEMWLRYGQWTRVNSDRGERIRHRHEYYCQRMSSYLQPLQLKDSKRLFGRLEKEIIYFRDKKRCRVCDSEVPWQDAEFHHVMGHAIGGQTTVDNGALVHKHCHPKGSAAASFAEGQANFSAA